MDGVVTRQELSPGSDAGQSTLTVTGEDLSRADGRWSRCRSCAIPAMPVDGARRADPAPSTRCSASCRWRSRRSFPTCRSRSSEIPAPEGHRPRLHQAAARRGAATSSTSSPGRRRARASPTSGRRSASRRAAAGAQRQHGRAHQRRVAQLQPRRHGRKKIVVITIFDPVTTKSPDPDPDAEHQPRCSRRSARGRRCRARSSSPKDMAKLGPAEAGDLRGLGRLMTARTTRSAAAARSTCCATAACCGRAGWSACAAPGSPTTASTTSRASRTHIKRGEYKQSFTLSRDGLISITPAVVP